MSAALAVRVVGGGEVAIDCRVGELSPAELNAVTAYSTVVPLGALLSVNVVTFAPTFDIFEKSAGNDGDEFVDRKILNPVSSLELSVQLSCTDAIENY
jgi:hypothetical protein